MMFRNQFSTPTEQQYAKIGRIICDWACLDVTFQMILTRLALGSDYVTNALTDSLSYEGRQMALRHLIQIHRYQFAYTTISESLCDDLEKLREWTIAHRPTRNKLTHWVAMRYTDDTLTLFRLMTRPHDSKREDTIQYSLAQLDEEAEEVRQMGETALALYERMPSRDPFERK